MGYTYDLANRLTQIAQGASTVGFSYDSASRRTSLTLPNGVTVAYSFDGASQLTGLSYSLGSTNLGSLTYAYDGDGRRAAVGGSLARTGLPLAVSSTHYNANNQLTQWGTANLTFDLNGNLTGDGVNNYSWDARNQLASITAASGGSTIGTFQYDAFGRRASKAVVGTTTSSLYERVNAVQELSGSTPTANLLTGGVDEFFSRTDSTGTHSPLTDALGSTVALTDSTGAVQTQYTYEPFGNTTVTGPASTNTFQYTGRENDGTGVYFYRSRYYSPVYQRFISEDPIKLAGGINLYAYAGVDPMDRTDPLGLCWIYVQSTGAMYSDYMNSNVFVYAGTGYSGMGQGLNNPGDQFTQNVGPIPQGFYDIGPLQNNPICAHCGPGGGPKFLGNSMRLTPDPDNNMGDPPRSGFLIHGGNMTNMNSSKGCIVLPLDVRNSMANSGDKCLEVVP